MGTDGVLRTTATGDIYNDPNDPACRPLLPWPPPVARKYVPVGPGFRIRAKDLEVGMVVEGGPGEWYKEGCDRAVQSVLHYSDSTVDVLFGRPPAPTDVDSVLQQFSWHEDERLLVRNSALVPTPAERIAALGSMVALLRRMR